MGGAPFAGAHAGDVGILALNTEPVALTPDAQANLTNEYAKAKQEKLCSDTVQSVNQQLWAANDVYKQCCITAESSYQSCESNCPSFPLSLFFSCDTNCKDTNNFIDSKNCETQYISAYNNLKLGENAACGNSGQISPGPSPLPGGTWFHCNQH